MPKNDLPKLLGTDRQKTIAKIGGVPLDPLDPWENAVLEEARHLSAWTGLAPDVVRVTAVGTSAYTCGIVTVNRSQLDGFFGGLSAADYPTAIFVALAHEFGHLLQYHYFGARWTTKETRRRLVEAHADFLGGTWLARRLGEGFDHTSNAAFNAGVSIKRSKDYPTPHQRGLLMQDGLGYGAGVVLADAAIAAMDPDDQEYVPFTARFALQDIRGTMKIVRHGIWKFQRAPAPPARTYSGPGTVRRASDA